MKPGLRIAFAILGTVGFGSWLVGYGGGDREIWIAIAGWLLGFWLASGIGAAERAHAGQIEPVRKKAARREPVDEPVDEVAEEDEPEDEWEVDGEDDTVG